MRGGDAFFGGRGEGDTYTKLMTSRRAEERMAPGGKSSEERSEGGFSGVLGLQIRSFGRRSSPLPANTIIESK